MRTAAIRACDSDTDVGWSTRKDRKLGRIEYCVETVATSPLNRYSNGTTSPGSTVPDPALVPTAITDRWNAPKRSSSATARAARPCAVLLESTPTNTRTGSRARVPENACSSGAEVTPATKARPWLPRSAHAMVESGPPETTALVGG